MSNGRISLPNPLTLYSPVEAPEDEAPTADMLRVCRRDSGWALMVDGLETPAWTLQTKRKAVRQAREAALELGCTLVVERSDGTVQNTCDYA